jgi:hypothetical protein
MAFDCMIGGLASCFTFVLGPPLPPRVSKPVRKEVVKVLVPTRSAVSDGCIECCICLDEIPPNELYECTYLCKCERAGMCATCFRSLYSGAQVRTAISARLAEAAEQRDESLYRPLDVKCALCNVEMGARILRDGEKPVVILKRGRPPLKRSLSSVCFEFQLKDPSFAGRSWRELEEPQSSFDFF